MQRKRLVSERLLLPKRLHQSDATILEWVLDRACIGALYIAGLSGESPGAVVSR